MNDFLWVLSSSEPCSLVVATQEWRPGNTRILCHYSRETVKIEGKRERMGHCYHFWIQWYLSWSSGGSCHSGDMCVSSTSQLFLLWTRNLWLHMRSLSLGKLWKVVWELGHVHFPLPEDSGIGTGVLGGCPALPQDRNCSTTPALHRHSRFISKQKTGTG